MVSTIENKTLVSLVDITPENKLARPKWNDVFKAEEGDILVQNKRIIGVVYSNSERTIGICNTNSYGVLFSYNFIPAKPNFFRCEGDEIRADICNGIPVADLPEELFNKIESIYTGTMGVFR